MQRQEPKIVKQWTTAAGLPAEVLLMPMGHHCGYVGVPPQHPAHGKGYDDELLYDIRVHGGLTYADKPPLQDNSSFWALGYDCAHLGDKIPGMPFGCDDGVFRGLDYCIDQCESLAQQLADLAERRYDYV